MAWTTPMTAVANQVWLASQFNTHVRDNLNETEAAKVTAAGQYVVATGANALATRTPSSASNSSDSGTTTSTSYTDTLTSGGTNPAVTITTGTKALVFIGAAISNSSANVFSCASFRVSSATTISSSDNWRLRQDGVSAGQPKRSGLWTLVSTLNAGSNVFTMQYKVQSGTGTFALRELIVVPF